MPEPGDIILYPVTPRSGWTSAAVALGEWGVHSGRRTDEVFYSHATIKHTKVDHEYASQWPRSGQFRCDMLRVWEVWRLTSLTPVQRLAVLDWCRANMGEWYNMIGLLTGGLLGLPRTAVCSQFVGRAYAAAGVHIHAGGLKLLSPNAIADYPGARYLGRHVPYMGWDENKRRP